MNELCKQLTLIYEITYWNYDGSNCITILTVNENKGMTIYDSLWVYEYYE